MSGLCLYGNISLFGLMVFLQQVSLCVLAASSLEFVDDRAGGTPYSVAVN